MRSGRVPASCATRTGSTRQRRCATASPRTATATRHCKRHVCARRQPPHHSSALPHSRARRAADVTCVWIFRTAPANGMARSSCTRMKEHTLTTTFEPITDALAPDTIDTIIAAALAEDIGPGDVTTDAVIPADTTCRGTIVCKQDGVIAGLSITQRVFQLIDERIQFDAKVKDGEKVQEDQIVARLHGPARGILKGERVGLNFLQHLSGIASTTARFVKAVEGTKTKILDTRKTTPGLRGFEKYATRMGGAVNHRMGLWDSVLVKDTHLALAGGVGAALRAVRKAHPEAPINVEVSNIQELEQALNDKAPRILLDNFAPGQVREAMQVIRGRAKVEISGGVVLTNARAYALAGADYISVGALTHSATALDFSLKVTRY